LYVVFAPAPAFEGTRMLTYSLPTSLLLACLVLFSGCGKKKDSSAPMERPAPSTNAESASPAPQALDGWQGTWNGPEGTYLKLTAKPVSGYEIVIKDLDGERSFEGVGSADEIHFTRDGRQERIRATDGTGTGMKWLAGKSECLTVKPGEGYCRE
jgi:hypothetical protein